MNEIKSQYLWVIMRRSTSARLIESANNYLDLEEVKDKVLLK